VNLFDLSGKVALITGGSRGLGLQMVRAFAQAGADVVIASRKLQACEAAAAEVRAMGRRALAHAMHAAKWDQIDAMVDAAYAQFGRIDILVNNAGIGAQGTVEENTDDEWHRVLDVNVVGIARVTRAALPWLRRSSSAAVVNTCSVAGWAGLPRRAVYSASKGAVHALTLAMAADHVREGVRVNCVMPGTADTPWVGRLLDAANDPAAERAALEARQPMGRLVSPEEVAAAIVYLASPTSGSTTGTALAVDGGMYGLRLPPR
jgi:NAD(P)-dependent dehydrogenase (short-subunit alcohol dehydrogenase family)